MSIFVISMHEIIFNENNFTFGDSRTIGYAETFQEAENYILEDPLLLEPSYNYIVIEEFDPGTYIPAKKEYFYILDYNKKTIQTCEKPKELNRIVNFGMG